MWLFKKKKTDILKEKVMQEISKIAQEIEDYSRICEVKNLFHPKSLKKNESEIDYLIKQCVKKIKEEGWENVNN